VHTSAQLFGFAFSLIPFQLKKVIPTKDMIPTPVFGYLARHQKRQLIFLLSLSWIELSYSEQLLPLLIRSSRNIKNILNTCFPFRIS
jgi:hypothetical protein